MYIHAETEEGMKATPGMTLYRCYTNGNRASQLPSSEASVKSTNAQGGANMQWCRGQLHDSSTVCTEEAGRITTRISQVTQILLAMGGGGGDRSCRTTRTVTHCTPFLRLELITKSARNKSVNRGTK